MSYIPTIWSNDSPPPINATNLNKIEQGIVDSQKFSLSLALPISNNRILIDELYAIEGVNNNVGISDSVFYDFPASTKQLTAGEIDLTKAFSDTVTQGLNTLDITSMIVGDITDFKVGQEITLQDDNGKEVLTIQSVVNPTITFTSNIANVYSSGANIYRSNLKVEGDVWKFGGFTQEIANANFDTWDDTLAQTGIDSSAIIVGDPVNNYMYVKSGNRFDRYDITGDSWITTLALSSNAWENACIDVENQKIYCNRSSSPYSILIYDIATDSWDESTGANPGEDYTHMTPRPYNGKIYTRSNGNIQRLLAYDINSNTWDTTLSLSGQNMASTNNGGIAIDIENGVVYPRSTDTSVFLVYDIDGDTWGSSIEMSVSLTYASFYDGYLYFINASGDLYRRNIDLSPRETMNDQVSECLQLCENDGRLYTQVNAGNLFTQYDARETVQSETDLTEVDLRMNITSWEDVDSLTAWLFTNNNANLTLDSKLSIVDQAADESYVDLAETEVEVDSSNNYYVSAGSVATPDDKVTLKYNLTRSLTTDDVQLQRLQGAVA